MPTHSDQRMIADTPTNAEDDADKKAAETGDLTGNGKYVANDYDEPRRSQLNVEGVNL